MFVIGSGGLGAVNGMKRESIPARLRKAFVLGIALSGLTTIGATVYVLRGQIAERWWLWRFEASLDGRERIRAAEKLAAMRSSNFMTIVFLEGTAKQKEANEKLPDSFIIWSIDQALLAGALWTEMERGGEVACRIEDYLTGLDKDLRPQVIDQAEFRDRIRKIHELINLWRH